MFIMVERISTGILGLDQCMEGGFVPNTAIAVIGSPGTGKTTFALQFLSKGIENDEEAIYITLEESEDKIIKNAKSLGFDWVDSGIEFIKANTQDFHENLCDMLLKLATECEKKQKEEKKRLRIVIDPITPILWRSLNNVEKRETIAEILKILTGMGTVIITVEEEHNKVAQSMDTSLLKYLADAVINLRFVGQGNTYDHLLRIIKMRSSKHERESFPIHILRGLGIVIQHRDVSQKKSVGESIPNHLMQKLEKVSQNLTEKQKKILTMKLAPLYSGRETLPHLLSADVIVNLIAADYERDLGLKPKIGELPYKTHPEWK